MFKDGRSGPSRSQRNVPSLSVVNAGGVNGKFLRRINVVFTNKAQQRNKNTFFSSNHMTNGWRKH